MIELDADQKTPLYEQLYAALADEIRTGQRLCAVIHADRRAGNSVTNRSVTS